MAAVVKPLASTLRVVEWDELPPSAREVPDNFNPLAEGVLMRHQAAFLAIKASIKVAPKGRRTGITFCEALDDTIKAASRKSAGGDNIYYIGDTKEKGLEFVGYCAKFARVIARAQEQGVSQIEEFLFEDQDADGKTKHITSYRIRFSSGFQVTALSSRPANIRGLQGKVVIDEAAFHSDVQGVLDAATALLIWGGEIVVISSHNGSRNPFNQLVKDIESGKYGDDAAVFTVTFDDAVANGLYERVCMMRGWTPTTEDKKKWYAKIRNGYGVRKAAMREELDAIPREGNGVCLPGVWIENAARQGRTVLRLALDDDFAKLPDLERRAWADGWIEKNLKPELLRLDKTLRHVGGMDYARHRDFSEIAPMAITQSLRRDVPFAIELHKVPTRQQEQILWALIRGLPRFSGVAIDATGSGQTLAEYTADEFGATHVHQVTLSQAWYGLWMPKMIDLFQDGMIDMPADADLTGDLRAIEEVNGIPMVPAIRTKDIKDPDLLRHGDFAIGLCLANFASYNLAAEIGYMDAGRAARAEHDEHFGSGFGAGAW
jgi:phage FluMu gp28-like protein